MRKSKLNYPFLCIMGIYLVVLFLGLYGVTDLIRYLLHR